MIYRSISTFYHSSSSFILPVLLIVVSSLPLLSYGQYNGHQMPGATSINNDCNTCQYGLQFLSFRERRYCCRNGYLQCCQLSQLGRPYYPEERPEYPIVDIPSSGPGPDPYRNQFAKEPDLSRPDNNLPGNSGYTTNGQIGQSLLRPDSMGAIRPDPMEEIRPNPMGETRPDPMEPSRSNSYGSQPGSTDYQQPGSGPIINPSSSSQFPSPSRFNHGSINPGNPMEGYNPYNQQPSYNNYQPNNHYSHHRPSNPTGFGSWPLGNPLIQGIVAPILSTLFQHNPSPAQTNANNNHGQSLFFDDNNNNNNNNNSNSNSKNENKNDDFKQFQGKRPNIGKISESSNNNENGENNGATLIFDGRLESQPTRSLDSSQNITTKLTTLQVSSTSTPTLL